MRQNMGPVLRGKVTKNWQTHNLLHAKNKGKGYASAKKTEKKA